jgi:integrase
VNFREFFSTSERGATENPRRSPGQCVALSQNLRLYRRASSSIWQCRFKLNDGQWHRLSTGSSDEAQAQTIAIKLAGQWASREQFGLPASRPTFGTIAREVRRRLEQSLTTKHGKVVYADYITVLDKYLIPFFGSHRFEDISTELLTEFDLWRETQARRVLFVSTMRTHSAAFNRVIDAARERGLLPLNKPPPTLSVSGERGKVRPGFDRGEIDHLLGYIAKWAQSGRLSIEREIRPLLRDYVEFLLFTGVRHGTEARRLEWRHLQWHLDGERRFLRIWVSGKTGPRYLIAKSGAVDALDRLAKRNLGLSLEQAIDRRAPEQVFVCGSGYEPHDLRGSFRRLMRDSGLLKDAANDTRTLYSLRHTYATFALQDGISIHTIARQMGTSVKMLERHYSKLTPMMNAAELAK